MPVSISMFSWSRSRLWLLILLGLSFGDVARGQYGGMEMGNEGNEWNALSPRYYMGLAAGRLIERDSGVCESGYHSCLDINATGICCSNSHYCIISPSQGPSCCAIGSNCDTPCSSDSFLCNKTLTLSSTTTVTSTCCPRACPSVSLYKCASSLGGGCCNYNAQCISSDDSSGCAMTLTSSSTTALVSVVPSGCTTNQIACASSLGGGCCNVGFGCTVLRGTNYCAATPGASSAVRTGGIGIIATESANSTSSNHGLSTGAKAGIGVGVSVIALACIGACVFVFTKHRRRSLSSKSSSNDLDIHIPPALSQISGSGTAASKTGSKGSEGSKRPTPSQRYGSDYFGPMAPSGPFTGGESGVSSPGLGSNRGVPVTPQSPSDIAAPVEIGGRERGREGRREGEKSESVGVVTTPGKEWEYVKGGRFREGIMELE